MPRRSLRTLAASAALAVVVTTALWAHTTLVKAAPAKNAVLAESPAEVRLWFSAAIDPALAGIDLLKADGAPLARLALTAGSDRKEIAGVLDAPLAPGAYIVSWKTAAADGHVVRGRYMFTVDPRAPAAGTD